MAASSAGTRLVARPPSRTRMLNCANSPFNVPPSAVVADAFPLLSVLNTIELPPDRHVAFVDDERPAFAGLSDDSPGWTPTKNPPVNSPLGQRRLISAWLSRAVSGQVKSAQVGWVGYEMGYEVEPAAPAPPPGLSRFATVRHADPWAFGWDALVAIGTLLLAATTAGLAFLTRRLAAASTADVASAMAANPDSGWTS